jgi:hypothetical protein
LKNRNHILCGLNLALFLCSFTLLSLTGFAASNGSPASHNCKQFNAKPDGMAGDVTQQLSEKSETESEDGAELQALALPFFFSCLQSGRIERHGKPVVVASGQPLNPIYISVHNFRI